MDQMWTVPVWRHGRLVPVPVCLRNTMKIRNCLALHNGRYRHGLETWTTFFSQ